MQRCSRFAIALFPAVLVAGTAGAQPLENPAPPSTTMDRHDGTSSVDLTLGLSIFPNADDIFGVRVEAFGQYTTPCGFGGYGVIPFSMVIGEGDDDSALGNIEGGVAHARRRGATSYVFHAGLTLPTADESFAGLLTNSANAYGRITDAALAAPETIWLRLGGSVIFRESEGFFRADLGLDAPLSSDIDPETIVRINVGVGYVGDGIAAMVELVTIGETGDHLWDHLSDYLRHTVAFTLSAPGGNVRVGLITPLDEDVRGDIYIIAISGRLYWPTRKGPR